MKEYFEEQTSAPARGGAGEELRDTGHTDQERKADGVLEQTLRTALNEAAVPEAAAPLLGTLRAELTKRAKARKPAENRKGRWNAAEAVCISPPIFAR